MVETRRIRRPALLAALVLVAVCIETATAVRLFDISTQRASAPIALQAETQAIGDALEDAPWIGDDAAPADLWFVTDATCAPCAQFGATELQSLRDQGYGVRVVVVSPREAGAQFGEAYEVSARLAQARQPDQFRRWAVAAASGAPQARLVSYSTDDAEAEGYVEWGRASLERLEDSFDANGAKAELPMLLWRKGSGWRALTGHRALNAEPAQRDVRLPG